MIVRSVIKDSDDRRTWCFGHGYSDYRRENAAISQDVESALLEWKGDAFWALQNGIDWKTRLGKHNQKEPLDQDVFNIIENREGVLKVFDFQSTLQDRHYVAQCSVFTIYSQEPITIMFQK